MLHRLRARCAAYPNATHDLSAHYDGNATLKDIHRIREDDIVDFIRNHPQEINLDKVDQIWFLDLVLLKGREVRQAKSPRRRSRTSG